MRVENTTTKGRNAQLGSQYKDKTSLISRTSNENSLFLKMLLSEDVTEGDASMQLRRILQYRQHDI